MKNKCRILFSLIGAIFYFLFFSNNTVMACDTSPVLTASNVTNIGGGFYTFDFQVCVGSDGSENGFNVTMGCGLNITATSAPTLTNAGQVATASISGGVLTYTWPGFPPTWWCPDDGIPGPCFNFTVTVNGNPANCPVTVTGINDGCLIISNSWSTTVPGPCIIDYVMTPPGSQSGTTVGSINNCALRPSQDIVVQVNIACNDTWTFSLCGGSAWDTYLYLSNSCCGAPIASNDDGCGLQSTITSALTIGTYYITIEAFSSGTTGPFTLNVTSAGVCNPLPVELLYFEGELIPTKLTHQLKWSTSAEINNDYFTMQRTKDFEHYEDLATITGAGNSNVTNEYFLEVNNPLPGISYYRLKQTDYDGTFKYSGIVTIEAPINNNLTISTIHPNPTAGLFVFDVTSSIPNERLTVDVFDQMGRLMLSEKIVQLENGSYEIPVVGLNDGIYLVHFNSGNSNQIQKLIILK